jgi:anti-sigma factor RsiW
VKARLLSLDSDEHRAVQSLLPWFVNGTLGGDEAGRVEAHVADCPRCQADAAFQVRLRGLDLAAAPAGDVDRGWAALRGRLDAQTETARRAPESPRRRWTGWLPLALGLQAAFVLVVAIAAFMPPRQPELYRTLGSAPGATAANALIVFRADATEAQMREALRSGEARLVGGPTATDAYLLRLPDRGATEALARLRAQPGVVRVESLEAEPAR